MPSILSIVGKSNSGKTTLIEKLIPELARRGYRVGTIKHHAHPGYDFDVPGKDTWRHARAGALAVAIVAPDKVGVVRRVEVEPPLEDVAAVMGDLDLILTEGYKSAPTPKIEVSRRERSTDLLCRDEELLAVVCNYPAQTASPCYAFDDVIGLGDLVEQFLRSRPV